MATKPENHDEDSFIILGTSPGTSLDIKCNGLANGDLSLDKVQMEDALKDLSVEANMALKAHFKLGECPSPASLMVASTIITEDKSTEELQKRFGEILDENVILKETLKQNNDSMKEQFMMIASFQEDMTKTHLMHKEKFDETKDLVERLRDENKKLKVELVSREVNSETGEHAKSGPPSAMEFVSSPDDDTVDKLTAQLDLVEKQRRQVIVDNEKLTWQKESLEHIVDATTKERDDIKEKLKKVELQLSNKDAEYSMEINTLKYTIQDLQNSLQAANMSNVSPQEVARRDAALKTLEAKITTLHGELKHAQLKIMELENIKLDFTRHKSCVTETVRMYKEQIQDLQTRLKEATTTVFQPARVSLEAAGGLAGNVKLYDRTLKHLAELMNKLTHGLSDSLVETLGVAISLHDYKLDRSSEEQFKQRLGDVTRQLERQHSDTLSNIGQVRGILSIFEGIFKDHSELLKKCTERSEPESPNVKALTAALVARANDIQTLEEEVNKLRNEKEDTELMKAQLDLYKSDFEAERQSRAKMASEKDTALTDLRAAQRRAHELTQQLEEVRRLNPGLHRTVTSRKPPAAASASPTAHTSPTNNPENRVFTCPKCLKFSSNQYKVMEDHFDFCLDDF